VSFRYLDDNEGFRFAIGKRVKAMRKEHGLSLDTLAANTDMSKAGIWQIERGRSEPGAATLLRLSIALRCTIDYLVKGD
jgi:transcriptional regulator with XRE-family HTH domain